MGGFLSMDSALSGILSSKRAIDVISHNIANASNESYSRQRAELRTADPLRIDRHSVGTGVLVGNISRARDQLLDNRLIQETQVHGRYDQLNSIYREIEQIINEPSGQGLRAGISELNSALQDLANEPENRGGREVVLSKAEDLANNLNRIYADLYDLGGSGDNNRIDSQIEATVEKINGIGERIADLNKQISSAEATGATPNDLLDERTELVRELSEYIDVRVNKTSNKYRVTAGGFTLVQNGSNYQYSFERKEPDGPRKILYEACTQEANITGGKLKALVDLRDDYIPGIIDQLNDFAVNFVDRFNDIHRNGFGLQGQTREDFWKPFTEQETGVFRFEGLGNIDGDITTRSAGFIDHPDEVLTGVVGSNYRENFQDDSGVQENPTGHLTINGKTIEYDMSSDTIHDIISRINRSDNQATAYLSAENRLVIKGTGENDYQIDELRDDGLLLEKTNILGIGGTARTGRLEVSETDLELVATGDFNFSDPLQAEGSLIFESTNSPGFEINYDLTEDSLEDIVSRINIAADQAGSNIAAEINQRDQLRIFATDQPPDPGLEPNVLENSAESFKVNDTASQQLADSVTAGVDVELQLTDVSGFNEGDTIIVSDGQEWEETTVLEVDTATNSLVVDLVNDYDGGPGNNGAVRRVEDFNQTRNFLSTAGFERYYLERDATTEFAVKGMSNRPPAGDAAYMFQVNSRIVDNPDLIAVSGDDDVDLTGIANTMKGPGDGSTVLELSQLHDENIFSEGRKTVDQYVSAFVSKIGTKASQVEREANISKQIVNDVTERIQSISGVNLDEELTNLIRHQQVFQASSRIINTVNDMSNSILQLL